MNGFDLKFFRWSGSGNETPSTSNNNNNTSDSYGKHRIVDNVAGSHLSRSTSRSVGSSFRQGADQGHKSGPSRSTSTSSRSTSRPRDEAADRSTGRHRSGSTSRRGEVSEGSSGHGHRSTSTLRRGQAAEGSLGRSTSTRPRSVSAALRREEAQEGFLGRSTSTRPRSVSTLRREEASEGSGSGISRCRSTFILKAPTVERDLECTLEELHRGCVKKIQVSRTVIRLDGTMVQEQEKLKIRVKPGWRNGTKITFEGMGDERPGTLPADLVFVIVEKQHPLFKRDGNDLILTREIPLVKALTGCSLSIPLINGDKMNIALKEIIRPGFEMILRGQGMPDVKYEQTKGDLKVEFQVKFPTRLRKEQQKEIKELLEGISFA